jgi:hypothetical protein
MREGYKGTPGGRPGIREKNARVLDEYAGTIGELAGMSVEYAGAPGEQEGLPDERPGMRDGDQGVGRLQSHGMLLIAVAQIPGI